jgi:hypothetical protein
MTENFTKFEHWLFGSNKRTALASGLIGILGFTGINLLSSQSPSSAERIDSEIISAYPQIEVTAKYGDTMSGLVYSRMQGIPWTIAKSQFQEDNDLQSEGVTAGQNYLVRVGTNYSNKVKSN